MEKKIKTYSTRFNTHRHLCRSLTFPQLIYHVNNLKLAQGIFQNNPMKNWIKLGQSTVNNQHWKMQGRQWDLVKGYCPDRLTSESILDLSTISKTVQFFKCIFELIIILKHICSIIMPVWQSRLQTNSSDYTTVTSTSHHENRTLNSRHVVNIINTHLGQMSR